MSIAPRVIDGQLIDGSFEYDIVSGRCDLTVSIADADVKFVKDFYRPMMHVLVTMDELDEGA